MASSCSSRYEAARTEVLLGSWVRRILVFCLLAEVMLVLLDTAIHFCRLIDHDEIRKLFNITREENLPTVFSSGQALFAGLVAFGVWAVHRRRGSGKWLCRGWLAVALFFTWIGVDDAARIHERVGTALGDTLDQGSGAPAAVQALLDLHTYYWQMFIAPLFALGGLFVVGFLWRQMAPLRLRRFLAGGILCLGLAVALDFIEGRGGVYESIAARFRWEDYTATHYAKVLEESLEMLGTTLFLYAFMATFVRLAAGLQLHLLAGSPDTAAAAALRLETGPGTEAASAPPETARC